MKPWYNSVSPEGDVAISTRIRIARNLKNYPFPSRMNDEQIRAVNELVLSSIANSNEEIAKEFKRIDMEYISETAAASLVEKSIVSPEFILDRRNKILLLSKDENISISLNDSDHIRISVILGGAVFEEAFEIADTIDNIISDSLSIAFSEQFGYLTECPTNLGTGMRASILLHLPATEKMNEIRRTAESVSKIGLSLSNAFSGEYENASSTYQLSNGITLGITESVAIENLKSIAYQVMSRERIYRETLDRVEVEDSCFRALGLLKNARRINEEEAAELLSKIRLGISLGIIAGIEPQTTTNLQITTKNNIIKNSFGDIDQTHIDEKRAEIIRDAFLN